MNSKTVRTKSEDLATSTSSILLSKVFPEADVIHKLLDHHVQLS